MPNSAHVKEKSRLSCRVNGMSSRQARLVSLDEGIFPPLVNAINARKKRANLPLSIIRFAWQDANENMNKIAQKPMRMCSLSQLVLSSCFQHQI